MRVVLKESSNVMDEVVITASGKVQKKINVTGAITGVEVATLKTPATSISNMLGGRVPGIISVTRSGEPGKDFLRVLGAWYQYLWCRTGSFGVD